MSHLLDRLTFFTRMPESFSNGHGITTGEARGWEDAYRKRWQHDKIVRSTHGANCTGSCSWKIYVKGGLVTWETQQTDYPRTRPELPNHEPRGPGGFPAEHQPRERGHQDWSWEIDDAPREVQGRPQGFEIEDDGNLVDDIRQPSGNEYACQQPLRWLSGSRCKPSEARTNDEVEDTRSERADVCVVSHFLLSLESSVAVGFETSRPQLALGNSPA